MQKSIKRWLSCGMVLVLMLTLLIPTQSVEAAAKKPKFNVTKKTMAVGEKTTLKISNKVKNAKYVWKTSKKSVATVSSKGSVKAVGKGSAVISCSVKVKNKTKYTLKCKITVTEPATKDFFERNNIEKSGGERDYMLRPVGSDVFEPMMVEVYSWLGDPEEEKAKQGYARLIYIVEWYEQSKWHPDKAIDYNLAVFDNITGRCLGSAQATTETSIGATTEDFSFTGEDGKKYDCSVTFSQNVSETGGKIMMEVIYPFKYIGRVGFQFGSFSDEQKAIYNKIDLEKGYVLDDVPELLKNQYFFISGF